MAEPKIENTTAQFYDEFWPNNVPDYVETKKYVLQTVSGRSYRNALDAGCGHGVCSVVLSEIAQNVTSVDISPACVATARQQAATHHRTNTTQLVADLQYLQLPSESFDLVWCWGVAMMAPDPMKVIHHLFRVTERGGELYLSLYLKTWLSPVHEGVRHFCRAFLNGPRRKKFVLGFFAKLTKLLVRMRGREINVRADNYTIEAQVDDFYYPPFKTFYSIEEILELFGKNGFEAQCTQSRIGRFKSATIFVIKGIKKTGI